MTAYRQYSRKWRARWARVEDVTDAAVADYARDRIGRVLRSSVRKELAALLGSFFGWLVEQRLVSEDHVPRRPKFLKKTPGVRSGKQKSRRVELEPRLVARFLAQIPEWAGKAGNRWRARDALTVLYETGLRPKTVGRLRTPQHFESGSRFLLVDDPIDKARFGRRLPLTRAARSALARTAAEPYDADTGLLFGVHDYRDLFARSPVKMPHGFSIYDLRHARGQHLVDAGAPLTGVAFLLGHKRLTTTNIYVRAQEREAAQALAAGGFRFRSGSAKKRGKGR